MAGLVMVLVIDRIRWRQWIRFDDQSVLVLLLSFAPLVMSGVFCLWFVEGGDVWRLKIVVKVLD
jgi:hypothetical protein